MGSVEIVEWLGDGYLEGDPLRSALFTGLAFLTMPLQLIAVILGRPF